MSGILNTITASASRPAVGFSATDFSNDIIYSELTTNEVGNGFVISSDGTWTIFGGEGSPKWLFQGSAGDYEVRWSPSGDAVTGSAINTWINAANNISWSVQIIGGTLAQATGFIEIRRSSTQGILYKNTLTMSYNDSGGGGGGGGGGGQEI